jgi:nuclear RNA export factor
VDVLRQFLSRRWNADSKYLNLDAIADDAILQDAGIEPPQKDDSNNVGSALMKLAGEMFPEVNWLIIFNHGAFINVLILY